MRTVRLIVAGLVWLGLSTNTYAEASPIQLAENEGQLLHRRLNLDAVAQWSWTASSWSPTFAKKHTAKVYVVNLWSLTCKPCIEEFPFFKRLVDGWKQNKNIEFVFVADPPQDNLATDLVAFWKQSAANLPNSPLCRAQSDSIGKDLSNDSKPLTLILDRNFVVRQAYVGSIVNRSLGSAIERLLRAESLQK